MKPIKGDDSKERGGLFTGRRRANTPGSGRVGSLVSQLQAVPGGAWARGALVGFVGLLLGYVFATQIIFPAAAAPTGFSKMPDLRGHTMVEALADLDELGLSVASTDSLLHPSAPAGTVLGQTPLPEQLADASTEVRLTLSTGTQQLAVPEVVGVSLSQAVDLLGASGFGFTVDTVESDELQGQVVASDPSEGELLGIPGQVALQVSAGPPPVEMPRLVGMDEADARATLDSLGLEVSGVEERFRFGLDQGAVIEQEPAAGVTVDVGSSVRLVVGRRGGSDGP